MSVIRTSNLHQTCRQARKDAHASEIPASRTPRGGRGLVRRRGVDHGRSALTRRLLDAARGLQPADSGLPEDPAGRRRQLQPVVRGLGRSGAGRQGRPEGGHRRALAGPRRGRARHGRARRREVEAPVLPRHGHELARRLRGPRRQPEEDPRLERPDPARRPGRHPEPVHLRRRALERDGGVRSAAEAREVRQAGAGLPAEAVQERRLAGQERARLTADVQRRPRRRSAGVRERGPLRPVAQPGLPVS